jgi:hypothetical protein
MLAADHPLSGFWGVDIVLARVEGAFLRMITVWCQPLKLGICDPHCRA